MKWLLIVFSIISVSQTEIIYENLYGNESFCCYVGNSIAAGLGGTSFVAEAAKFLYAEPPDRTPKNGSQFDFIVVGAGTAGATIAARLSEIPEVRVLLIEAGSKEKLSMDIPITAHSLQSRNDIDWRYRTERSNNYCTGMTDNQCNWPRGKVMGGSSVLNYMIATRGDPRDYARWAELGNKDWSWRDVLPYFKKLETMSIPRYRLNKRVHNDRGPVNINYPPFQTPLASAFLKAGMELGYRIIDYNSGDEPIGFSYLQTTTKRGLRISSSTAYLHSAKSRKNLIVTKNTLVSRVLFDRTGKQVIGVEYIKGRRVYRAYVMKEVILSAGAIGSPQILMLSGIGPTKHLTDMKIKTRVDLPVGKNLMDHIAHGGLIFQVNQPVGVRRTDLQNVFYPYMKDFLLHKDGPLTIPGACEALAFIDVDRAKNHTAYPNVELLFASSSFASVNDVRHSLGLAETVWQETYKAIENTYTWTVFPMLLRPKSRGRILLRTSNIYSKPRIIPNYMNDKEDVRILIEGVKAALKVSKTRAMQRFGTKLFPARLKQCQGFVMYSDAYWECAIRTVTMNIYHYSGTCKMGPRGDATAVVDPRLRVHGIKGLRVADASIMPEIISAHTNIPTFMIGEKLSDMVKQDWRYPTYTSSHKYS